MTFDPNRLIALIGKQAEEIEALRVALKRLLLNYSAALPEGQKDQRSIAEARRLLGLDEQSAREREEAETAKALDVIDRDFKR